MQDREQGIAYNPVSVKYIFCGRGPLRGAPCPHLPMSTRLCGPPHTGPTLGSGRKWWCATLTLGYKRLWHLFCPGVLFKFLFLFKFSLGSLALLEASSLMERPTWQGSEGSGREPVGSGGLLQPVRLTVCPPAPAEPRDGQSLGRQSVSNPARGPEPEPPAGPCLDSWPSKSVR